MLQSPPGIFEHGMRIGETDADIGRKPEILAGKYRNISMFKQIGCKITVGRDFVAVGRMFADYAWQDTIR